MDQARAALVKGQLETYRLQFEAYLADSASRRAQGVPPVLFEAMEYSLTSGGKRLRPVLCLAAAERCGRAAAEALPMAAGIEMLHVSTLIHDDLPCIDNDDMRRGKPSNHKVFGESLAVFAGDALEAQALGFPLEETKQTAPEKLLRAMRFFAEAAGPRGVLGGQALDTDPAQAKDAESVRRIVALKTGAIIRAALLCGAALGTDDENVLARYGEYGAHIGAAFQIVDDILDVISTPEELGKTPGKDAEQGKITHVTVFGMERAKEMAAEESRLAQAALAPILQPDDFLLLLPEYLVHRTH